MLLTASDLMELGKRLDAARTDPAARCGAQLQTPEGQTSRLEPKPQAQAATLRRKLGEDSVVLPEGSDVPHVVVPLGTCGAMNLGIDPETGEVACTVHGKGGR